MSSDTKEDPMALKEVAAKAVEDEATAESGPRKVASPRISTYTVILETDSAIINNDLHDNLAEQKRFLLEREIANDEGVLKVNEIAGEENNIEPAPPLAKAEKSVDDIKERPVLKRRKLQRITTSKMVDQHISNARKVTVELLDKLKLSQKEFARELKRAEKLTATLKAKDQSHAAELALKAKELQDCEAFLTSELERRKELDVDCSKLCSQFSAVSRSSSKIVRDGGNSPAVGTTDGCCIVRKSRVGQGSS
ncbi:hypothetical protein AXG93_2255s1290 [Marchantia polymorpha subsp. ruderalis]|uniref:Uncharacterized protein n=1 Tax=Marchantia polymorpha subsp. ruderalis TaxID=1480154 RepID=A0A176W9W2_MARPO|nr:hypothetical protein AXG93_2255s1290 [Marchantia polymorpha subsp. ruderalis]